MSVVSAGGGCRLGAAHQATGEGACSFAVAVRLHAGDEGVGPSVGALKKPLATCWEVGDDLRLVQAQVVVVDDIDVGSVTRRKHATVEQADCLGRVAAMLLHEVRQRQGAALAIAAPIGKQGCRKGSVADRADVSPTVAEARHSERVAHHLVEAIEGTINVVEEG